MAVRIHSFISFVLYSILFALSTGLELSPVRVGSWQDHNDKKIQSRDVSALDLKKFQSFLWEAEDEDDLIYGNLTVHALGDSEGILSLESFEPLVKSIKCEPNQLTLNFIDDPTFEYAKKVWDWVNGADDHSFIIVAGPGDCGTNKYRVPYLVSRLNYDEKLNIARLAARADEWKNLIHAYTLNVKSTKLPAHRRIVRRDGGKAFSLTKDLQFSAKVEIGAVEGTLECDNCGLSGYLNVDMEVSKGFPKLIDKALIRVQPKGIKLIAEPKLTIAASHKFDPAPWRVPLIPSIPIGTGITIGGFIKLGTFLGLKGGIEITTIQGSITIETGATVTISDSALLEVDFVNLGKGVTRQNWTPIVNKKPIRITGSASAGLQVYLMPEVELEASALDFGYEAVFEVKAPYIEVKGTLKADNKPYDCDGKLAKSSLEVESSMGVEIKFEAGKIKGKHAVDVSIATLPLVKGPGFCVVLISGNGSKGPGSGNSGSPPSVSPPPNPSANAPKCTIKSGTKGICIATQSCKNRGGKSEAGHCPGAANIQCCTGATSTGSVNASPGVGNSCKVDGVGGTCKDTADCLGPVLTHIAGHCPGPTNVQCCIKTSEKKPPFIGPPVPDWVGKKCTANSASGTCKATSDCLGPVYSHVAGHCPGPTNVQCCIKTGDKKPPFIGPPVPDWVGKKCTADGAAGDCKATSDCLGPVYSHVAGHCPGPTNVQCCIKTSQKAKPKPPFIGPPVPEWAGKSCTANGASGTCKATTDCLGPVYTPIAGHCPGPTNVKCCVKTSAQAKAAAPKPAPKPAPAPAPPKGVGDTCHANGITGTCMLTKNCPSSTGQSVPGYCPRGASNVQCCVTKSANKAATSTGTKLCTITKSGLKNSGFNGECISTSKCSSLGGTSTAGFCPGTGSSTQCCTYGTCRDIAGVCEPKSSCTKTTTPGKCKGGSNIQCCHSSGTVHATGDEAMHGGSGSPARYVHAGMI